MPRKHWYELGPTYEDLVRESGLSRQDIADAAGCSIAVIRLVERGYQPLNRAVRRSMAEALGIQEAGLGHAIAAGSLRSLA